jgi:hypothetical protein
MQAEWHETAYEMLQHSEGFDSLDAKLAAALTSTVSGELGRRIAMAVENEAMRHRMLKGRQILWMIHDHHKLDEERGALYDFTDLMSVKLKGDSQLESFWNTWESVLSAMTRPPGADIIEILFLEQLRHCSALREEISHYDRARRGTPERTYEFLVESVKRYLERARRARNRKAMERALGGAAIAAPASTTPKAKGKGKGKGGSRTPSPGRKGKGSGKGRNSPRPAGSPGAICYDFQKTGCCNKPNCKYAHTQRSSPRSKGPSRGRSPSKGRGEGKRKGSRSKSGSGNGSPRSAVPCKYYASGAC